MLPAEPSPQPSHPLFTLETRKSPSLTPTFSHQVQLQNTTQIGAGIQDPLPLLKSSKPHSLWKQTEHPSEINQSHGHLILYLIWLGLLNGRLGPKRTNYSKTNSCRRKCLTHFFSLSVNVLAAHLEVGVVVPACNPRSQEAEARGSPVRGHPESHNQILTQNEKGQKDKRCHMWRKDDREGGDERVEMAYSSCMQERINTE